MKGRMLSVLLAMLLPAGAFCVPAQAAQAPGTYRLVGAELSRDGETAVRYTLTYPDGGVLPGQEKTEYLTSEAEDQICSYTYDEAGRLTQVYGYAAAGADEGPAFSTYVYGDDGELVEDNSAANTTGDVYMFRYTYDEAGRLTEEGSSRTMADGTMSTYDALYSYDEAGRVSQRLSGDGGELTNVTDYVYDEAGNVAATTVCTVLAMDYSDEGMPVVTEKSEPIAETQYAYDGQGRLSGVETRMDGKPAAEAGYAYTEAPLLQLRTITQQDYDEQGTALPEQTLTFLAILTDSAGQDILRFSLQGSPELTFDDGGYLVKAEAGGRTLEFTYEPAA